MTLEGKTAVVTGASSGIGASTVRKLREAGARVVGGARRVERVDADLALSLDVTEPESCSAFVDEVVAQLGGIDILFNNAGLALGRYPFWESNEDDEARVLHTNVDGVMRMTRLSLSDPRQCKGALGTIARVLKGWQEEAEAGSEKRTWRWLLEGDIDEAGYDHNGEQASLWCFVRLTLERGGFGEQEKGEDIDLDGFGLEIPGSDDKVSR